MQDALLDRLAVRARQVGGRIEELTADLSTAQLEWRPRPRAWSTAQVLEHLALAAGLYLQRMRNALDHRRGRIGARRPAPWRPTLWGRVLLWAIDPGGAPWVPVPRAFAPGPMPRPTVRADFRRTQEELLELLARADGLDLNRVRLGSPVSGLIRLNLGDCFALLVTHAERHAGQLQRIRAAGRFPA